MKKTHITGFTPEALTMIRGYEWPGNIRQLANTIERAVILEESDRISVQVLHIPELFAKTLLEERTTEPLEAQEKALILRALAENLWVQKNAARCLGISPRALNYKVKKFGITHENWRKHKKR
jgi:DNA-binding NtrC family response regulator